MCAPSGSPGQISLMSARVTPGWFKMREAFRWLWRQLGHACRPMLPFCRKSGGEPFCTVFRKGMNESSDDSIEQVYPQPDGTSVATDRLAARTTVRRLPTASPLSKLGGSARSAAVLVCSCGSSFTEKTDVHESRGQACSTSGAVTSFGT